LLWAYVSASSGKDKETEETKRHRMEASDQYFQAINAFWRTRLAMEIVCGRKIGEQFHSTRRLTTWPPTSRDAEYRRQGPG
jgi:hypothetical protein